MLSDFIGDPSDLVGDLPGDKDSWEALPGEAADA